MNYVTIHVVCSFANTLFLKYKYKQQFICETDEHKIVSFIVKIVTVCPTVPMCSQWMYTMVFCNSRY